MKMTDEELSGLAEMLADACAEFPPTCVCPLQVAFGANYDRIAKEHGIPQDVIWSFAAGYDGRTNGAYGSTPTNDGAFALGRLFREAYQQ